MDSLDNAATPPGQLKADGERFLPGQMSGTIALEHVHRYRFASQLVAGKVVLDIACGEGYGTALLAATAQRAFGVDIAADAVAHAGRKYGAGNLEYRVGSCAAIPLEDSSVDVVVSFETIEHHDQHEAMMREIKRVLRPGGVLVISSPDKLEYSDKPAYRNPFHVRELYREEFEALLGSHFQFRQLFGQRVVDGSVLVADAESQPLVFDRLEGEGHAASTLPTPMYWVAVASDETLPPISGGLLEQTPEKPGAAAARERNRAIAEFVQAIAMPGSQVLRALLQETYPRKNPDVAAAGVDPETHWNMVGRIEGRELTDDPPALVQLLAQERQQALLGQIGTLQAALRDSEARAQEREQVLAAELAQAMLAGARAVESHLRSDLEREQAFARELGQLRQESSQIERALADKLHEASAGFAQRERRLIEELAAKEREQRDQQDEAQGRLQELHAELAQEKVHSRAEVAAQLRLQVERERQATAELLKMRAEADAKWGQQLETLKREFTAYAKESVRREDELRAQLARKDEELRSLERQAAQHRAEFEAERVRVLAQARADVEAQMELRVEREAVLHRQSALWQGEAEARRAALERAGDEKIAALTRAQAQREEDWRNEATRREERLRAEAVAREQRLRSEAAAAAMEQAVRAQQLRDQLEQASGHHEEQGRRMVAELEQLRGYVTWMRSTPAWRWRLPFRAEAPRIPPLQPALAHAGSTRSIPSPAPMSNETTNPSPVVTATSVQQLLAHDGEAFVECAYLSLLGRMPDSDGFRHYMNRYRDGVSKLEILDQIRSSPEGAQLGLSVPGLKAALARHSLLSIPGVGSLLKLAGLRQVPDMQPGPPSEPSVSAPSAGPVPASGGISPEVTREEFDAEWYLAHYADVAKAGVDPYEHYVTAGRFEKRRPRPSGFPQVAPVSEDECTRLRSTQETWPRQPLISILMPVYNTPEPWLRAALDSVLAQVYGNWELCIADDASPQEHVKQVLEQYRKRDGRIKVTYRAQNGRVSAASNSALALATGDFTVLFDHDDLLEPHALHHVAEALLIDLPDMVYSDELIVDTSGQKVIEHAFRPAFSLELLRSHPYIVHMVGFRTELLRTIGGFDESLSISQDYDLILRCTEQANHIVHIPKALYRWRTHEGSEGHNSMERVMATSKRVIAAHLERCGEAGTVRDGPRFNFFETRYALTEGLRVAIIVPTKNLGGLVRQCVQSIEATVTGISYDFVLVDHDSDDEASVAYFRELGRKHTVLRYHGEFNFSAINNWAVRQLERTYSHYLFCNNDIEALHEGWLARMLELAQKPDIGVVGAKLYYPGSQTIQHAGVCVGMYGAAEHYGKFLDKDMPGGQGIHPGYMGSLITNREMSAVTAACMLMRSDAFAKVRGFDEMAKVGFGDVDLCLRVLEAGYRVVFCPHAQLIHHESVSRGKSTTDPHPDDSLYYRNRWQPFMDRGDPFYNPNLSLINTFWGLKEKDDLVPDLARMEKRRSFHRLLGSSAGTARTGKASPGL